MIAVTACHKRPHHGAVHPPAHKACVVGRCKATSLTAACAMPEESLLCFLAWQTVASQQPIVATYSSLVMAVEMCCSWLLRCAANTKPANKLRQQHPSVHSLHVEMLKGVHCLACMYDQTSFALCARQQPQVAGSSAGVNELRLGCQGARLNGILHAGHSSAPARPQRAQPAGCPTECTAPED